MLIFLHDFPPQCKYFFKVFQDKLRFHIFSMRADRLNIKSVL